MFVELKQEGRKWGIKESKTNKVSAKLVVLLLSISLMIFVGLPGALMVLEKIRKNNPFKPSQPIIEAKERFKIVFHQRPSFKKIEPPEGMGGYKTTDNSKEQIYQSPHVRILIKDRGPHRRGAEETVLSRARPEENSSSSQIFSPQNQAPIPSSEDDSTTSTK